MVNVEGVHHVGLSVQDADRSIAWYRDNFGFQVADQVVIDDVGLRIVFLANRDIKIELFEQRGSEELRPSERDLMASFHYQGWRHLAFSVNCVDATWAQLGGAGLDLATPPTSNHELGVRYCFVRDPDGNLVELVQEIEKLRSIEQD